MLLIVRSGKRSVIAERTEIYVNKKRYINIPEMEMFVPVCVVFVSFSSLNVYLL